MSISGSSWLKFGLFTVGLGQSFVFVLVPPLARDLGLSEVQTSSIFAISAFAWALTSAFWGRTSDKYGRRNIAVLGLIGMWVGWQGLGAVLSIAAVTGIIIGGISLLKNREKNQEFTTLLQTQIPFAPYLCLAGLTVYLIQEAGYRNFVLGFDYF